MRLMNAVAVNYESKIQSRYCLHSEVQPAIFVSKIMEVQSEEDF